MASVPTIAPIQSILGFPQWEVFSVQFTATQTPTSWSITPTAPGLFFDTTAGTLFGAVTSPGLYSFYVTATNDTGDSVPLLFTISIVASSAILANVLELTIDVITRQVTLPAYVTAAMLDLPGPDLSNPLDPQPAALFWGKAGDTLLIQITFVKNGQPVAPLVTALELTLKEFINDNVLLVASAFAPIGSGDSTAFLLAAVLETPALRSALSNYQANYTDVFIALAEIMWQETNGILPSVGPGTLQSTSQSFGIALPYDMTPPL